MVAPYDLVGQYDQDEINGLDDALIERLLDIARLPGTQNVLDAMAGDGNLSYRLFRFCVARGIPLPHVTVLELSQLQTNTAAQRLQGFPAEIIWGDILKMQSLADQQRSPSTAFDRVLIKSSNHEIPLDVQERLYRNIYELLTPRGLFVNLGFLFDDEAERDELHEIARTKDTLAGLQLAVKNRHFLTRSEFYERLRRAGFVDIETARAFMYRIRSEVVAQRYFPTEVIEAYSLEFQIAQLRATTMRRKGRIRFEADASIMECPGEITVARRPTLLEETQAIYQRYPYDFLRHIKAHREMLARAAEFVESGSRVLDAGCGIGLMAEKVAAQTSRYFAVDANPEFVEICGTRMRPHRHVEAALGDLNHLRVDTAAFDCVLALNVIYQQGVMPAQVLGMLRDALRPGGTLVLSAPKSAMSFQECERRILDDLDNEGALSGKDEIIQQIRVANEKLLTANAHYWKAEEMAKLLLELGFSEIRHIDESLYYGTAWLLAATR